MEGRAEEREHALGSFERFLSKHDGELGSLMEDEKSFVRWPMSTNTFEYFSHLLTALPEEGKESVECM
jgi:hypothetical protein